MKFNKNATWAECFCAYAITNNVLTKEKFIVGDCGNECLPDIYNDSKTLGIEVVQLEKECDIDTKYIWKCYKENSGDFKSIKKLCDNKYKDIYDLKERDGKIASFSTIEEAHSVDWMKDTYEKYITLKLAKLNNQRYSGVKGQVHLCMSTILRDRSLYDIKLILYVYLKNCEKYKLKYDKLIIITSSALYLIDPSKVSLNQVFVTMNQDTIVDINIEGNDCISTHYYDYNECNKFATERFREIQLSK